MNTTLFTGYRITFSKPGESYVFAFDTSPASRKRLMEKLAEYAADPELSFTETDAAAMRLAVGLEFGDEELQ